MIYVKEAFDTNWVAPLGKNVDMLEKEVASYVNRKHAAADFGHGGHTSWA